MPLFKIFSNVDLPDRKAFIIKATAEVAKILGKDQKWVMVVFVPNLDLVFSASEEPAIYAELKSIGLPKDKIGSIAGKIMQFLELETGVAPSRMFIEFTDVQRDMWGWNGNTI
jgi:phenylpyruvate tautomerase